MPYYNYNFLLPDNCPCPPSPVNGSIVSCVGPALVGAYIHYYCDSGYERVGDFRRMCQVGATWTGSAPTCEKSKWMHNTIIDFNFEDSNDYYTLFAITLLVQYNTHTHNPLMFHIKGLLNNS